MIKTKIYVPPEPTVEDPTVYSERDYYNRIRNLKNDKAETLWTPEMIEEWKECEDSILEFCKYVKIVTIDEGLTRIKPLDFQIDIWNKLEQNRFVIILASRQTFKTTTIAVFILWKVIFESNYQVILLSKDTPTAKKILARIKGMYKELPMWLQPGVVEWNKMSISLANDSTIEVVSTTSEAGRGATGNFVYIDEAAFIKNDVEFLSAVFPTISSGESSKLVMTSTINGMGNEFYRYWVEAKKGINGFVPIEVKWNQVPWRGEEYKRAMITKIGKQKWDVEFENKVLASGNTLVDLETLDKIKTKNPIHIDRLGGHIHEDAKEGHRYLIVADCSHGRGLDYSAFVVFDTTDLACLVQVASFANNEILPTEFAKIIADYGLKYNTAWVAVEVNEIGSLVNHALINEIGYPKVVYSPRSKTITGYSTARDPGIKTTIRSKRAGCMMLAELISTHQLIIKDRRIVNELMVFEKQGDTYAAAHGKNDDLVMCLVLMAYMKSEPVLFRHVFGEGEEIDFSALQAIRNDLFVLTEELESQLPPRWLIPYE